MRWIILIGAVVVMAGCCCTRIVAVRPVPVAPVVEPVMIFPYSPGLIDVTTTTIDYY